MQKQWLTASSAGFVKLSSSLIGVPKLVIAVVPLCELPPLPLPLPRPLDGDPIDEGLVKLILA